MVPLNRANTWKGRRGITPFEARISRERLPGPREPPFTTESAAIYGETADHFHALEKKVASLRNRYSIYPPNYVALNLVELFLSPRRARVPRFLLLFSLSLSCFY